MENVESTKWVTQLICPESQYNTQTELGTYLILVTLSCFENFSERQINYTIKNLCTYTLY